jgi:hypothetical protein
VATSAILTIHEAIERSGIPVRSAGPVVTVRNIAGSSRPSQHSYGNASDWYPSSSDQAAAAKRGERVASLESLYDFLARSKANGTLPVKTLCYYRRGGCTTDHLDHVHVDGDPSVSRITDGEADQSYIDQIQGAFDATIEGTPGGIQDIPNPISNVTDFLGILASGELWIRVGFVIGGFVAIGAGLYFIAKEFGAPSLTTVAGTAVGSKIPG